MPAEVPWSNPRPRPVTISASADPAIGMIRLTLGEWIAGKIPAQQPRGSKGNSRTECIIARKLARLASACHGAAGVHSARALFRGDGQHLQPDPRLPVLRWIDLSRGDQGLRSVAAGDRLAAGLNVPATVITTNFQRPPKGTDPHGDAGLAS